MQSLYPCIMSILIFPQKFGQKTAQYTRQNMVYTRRLEKMPDFSCVLQNNTAKADLRAG